MGSRQRADRLCRAAAARLGRTSTSAPSNRSYTVGGDSQIVADELRKVPGRLAGRDVTVSFEVGDFGDQPLLLGENAAEALEFDISPRKAGASVFSHTLGAWLPVRRLPGGLIALDLCALASGDDEYEDALDADLCAQLSAYLSLSANEIRTLHRRLGHPGTEKLLSILTNARADEATLKLAKEAQKQCASCQQTGNRAKHSSGAGAGSTALRRAEVFVGDVKYFRKQPILHFTDVFSRYQRAYVLDVEANGQVPVAGVVRCLQQLRVDMGLPTSLFIDGDGLLNNDEVGQFLRDHGVQLLLSGANAPWQNGLAERHGHLLGQALERFYLESDADPDLPATAPLRVVLPVLVARKNELPGDASVEGISPFEAWHGRRPQSHLLGINNAAIDHGQEAHPRFGDEWRRLRAITERIDRVLLEARSRKVVTDALRKSVKPARDYTPGDDFWFYTEKGSKVKVSGWKGPARLLQVEKRIAVLRYNGRFYERSVDDIKPFCPPHGDPAAAAALQASRADRAAETAQLSATQSVSSHALLRSVLHRLQRNRPVHAQTAEMLERHFGRRFLGAQLAKNPLRYQGLRNVAFSQLGSRVTVLFDAQGRELWRHEDAGAPMRRAIPMSPHLAPTIHAQVALFFRPGSVGTPLDESDDDEKKQSVGAGENTADVTEDDSSLDDQHDLEPPTSPSPPPVDIPDSVEPPTQEDMTMEVAPPPPADDEPTTPPGYTAEYDPPTVTIIGEEPPPSMNTPPPAGNHPEMFSIATPGDSPDHAEDDDGDEQGDADDFEDAQETHEQDATPTPSERPEEAHVEPQPPTAFAPSYGPARVPPPSQAPQRRSSRLNKDLQTSPLK